MGCYGLIFWVSHSHYFYDFNKRRRYTNFEKLSHTLKKYGDYTHSCSNAGKLDVILKTLNNCYPKIQFTYELKKEDKISFMDVLFRWLL